MGESARDERYSAGTLRAAIAAVLRDRGLRAAALSGLCIVSLAPAASALSLGELEVRSRLGEPLEATLPLTLAAGESLAAGCISQGTASDGLARLPQLGIQAPVTSQAGTYTVRLATPRPLHEPMYGIELRVACPGTPVVVRQYVLMLDLPGTALPLVPAAAVTPAVTPAASSAAAPPAASQPRPAAPRATVRAERSPITQGSSYRVAAGDTLSLIAQRVAGRNGVGIWDMAARIQQANPSAFINGNPDLIRLGSELLIPVLGEVSDPLARPAADMAPRGVVPPPLPAEPAPAETAPAPAAAPATEAGSGPALAQATVEDIAAVPVAAEVEAAITPPLPVPLVEPAAIETAASAPTNEAALALAPAAPARRGANPLLATAVGIGLGLLISLLFGRISLAGLRRGQAAASRPTGAPAPVSRSRAEDDAGITVVESPAPDAAPDLSLAVAATSAAASLAAATATPAAAGQAPARPLAGLDWRDLDEDITDELSALFGDEDLALPETSPTASTTADLPALSGDTLQATAVEQTDLDSADPSSTAAISGLDWDTLDVSVEDQEPATSSPPALAASTGIDLPALAASATHDEKLSESLVEALKLLEQDYQQEMTATQLAPMVDPLAIEPTVTEEISSIVDGPTVDEATAEQPAPLKRRGTG